MEKQQPTGYGVDQVKGGWERNAGTLRVVYSDPDSGFEGGKRYASVRTAKEDQLGDNLIAG